MKLKFKLTQHWIDFISDFSLTDDTDNLGELFLNTILVLLGSLTIFLYSLILFIPVCISLLCEFIYIKINITYSKKYTLKVINKYYKDLIPENKYYYLKCYNNNDQSLELFIRRFIAYYKDDYCTYEVGTNDFICGTDKRRSVHDIYLISRNYYKDITINDVLKILVNLRNNNQIRGSYCTTICKYVYHISSNYRDDNDSTEYGYGIKFKDLINAYKE